MVSKIGEGVYQDSAYVSYGEEEKDQYFYFQDHLGSSTYITTLNGEVAQYAAYTPYGELFREYRNVTPYKFNGKELDAETGLYYYGARYYNPATALCFAKLEKSQSELYPHVFSPNKLGDSYLRIIVIEEDGVFSKKSNHIMIPIIVN